MNLLHHCILTGYQFEKAIPLDPTNRPIIEYFHIAPGNVKIALPTMMGFINSNQYEHPVLAGICRNAYENEEEPPIITNEFIQSGIKNISYPKKFKEKARHLLKHIYQKGGKDYKTFLFLSTRDYPICYAEGNDEFIKIMEYLEGKYLIKWKHETSFSLGRKQYLDVQLEEGGIDEVEKELPKMPLIGLISQEVSTGFFEIDQQVNHAKVLFFHEPASFEKMRSACETLSFVLEPLREDAKKYFTAKDVEAFFHIVNEFDIRHNKERTKNIEHPEQLEWIFYSLLNTINTYTKLKRRLE